MVCLFSPRRQATGFCRSPRGGRYSSALAIDLASRVYAAGARYERANNRPAGVTISERRVVHEASMSAGIRHLVHPSCTPRTGAGMVRHQSLNHLVTRAPDYAGLDIDAANPAPRFTMEVTTGVGLAPMSFTNPSSTLNLDLPTSEYDRASGSQ